MLYNKKYVTLRYVTLRYVTLRYVTLRSSYMAIICVVFFYGWIGNRDKKRCEDVLYPIQPQYIQFDW